MADVRPAAATSAADPTVANRHVDVVQTALGWPSAPAAGRERVPRSTCNPDLEDLEAEMENDGVLKRARAAIGVDRVYGTPIERDGVTVLPAARVFGCGCGGGDSDGDAGFGLAARPAGALIVDASGETVWRPAVDVNRIVLGAQIVTAVIGLGLVLLGRARIKAGS